MTVEYKTEQQVFRALRKLYDENAYALLPHVPDSTGARQKRTADAVVVGLWPSRGHEIEGFEIKVSRADWLRELKDPSKSAPVQKYCDRWWVVAGVRGIVEEEELPKTWGLIQPWGESLRREVKAPALEPQSIDIGFMAALIRQTVRHESDEAALKSEYERGLKEGRKRGKELAEGRAVGRAKRAEESLANLRKRIELFEEASGLNIRGDNFRHQLTSYSRKSPEKLGDIVHAILEARHDLDFWARRLAVANDAIASALRAVERIPEPTQRTIEEAAE